MRDYSKTWITCKKVLVLGAGKSGMAAAKFLYYKGAVVGIYDDVETKQSIPQAICVTSEKQIEFEKFDLCVISPGVSINHKIARKFEGRNISELALGFTDKHKKVVAVTGTNGKTTVTKMIAAALGRRGVACGNVGVPVTSVADELRRKIAVAEVSSFMLEAPGDFCSDISVILNITQDHLERHGSMQEYIRCKSVLAGNSKTLILNYDDENCRALGNQRSLFFSTTKAVRGIYIDGKDICLNLKNKPKKLFNIDDFGETKPHAIQNILATILVCHLLKVSKRRIMAACNGHRTNEHRIQSVANIGNVTFYNDSKATNIAACLAACRCFKCPINLLVGGQVKGQNFAELFEKLPNMVEQVFCFGSGEDVIMESAKQRNFKNITKCADMAEATKAAYEHGFGPRVVLLSPACASLDEYKSYAERGEKFTEIVRGLADDTVQ